MLVAPFYTSERFGDYQRLGRAGRGSRADLGLHAIVDEVSVLTGASATRFHLFGYSAGAQFVHRYTLAHPHRVARAVVAAAGWYTFPDPRRRFPYGIKPTWRLPDLHFDAEEFLQVPIAVLVGEDDGSDANLRRSERLDKQQGVTRVERAERWVTAMRTAAERHPLEPRVTLERVAGIDHSFARFTTAGALGERVCRALFGLRAAPDAAAG